MFSVVVVGGVSLGIIATNGFWCLSGQKRFSLYAEVVVVDVVAFVDYQLVSRLVQLRLRLHCLPEPSLALVQLRLRLRLLPLRLRR